MARAVIVFCIVFAGAMPVLSDDPGRGPFEIDALHDGIWLFRVPSDSREHTNSLVFELDSGLLVVESQPSPQAAEQLIRAIRKISDGPIQYLVLGHAGVSSSGGASAFPQHTIVIASIGTHQALQDDAQDLAGDARLRALDPESWKAPPRVLPELLLGGRTTLASAKYHVELLPIALAHFPGSVVVRVEDLGLYYVGAMAGADRNPYADVERTNMFSWVSWINSLVMQNPTTVVTLRGETLDEKDMREFRDSLGWVLFQVEAAFANLVPSAEIVDVAMDNPDLAEHFDVKAEPFLVRTLFERARLDGLSQRTKRGVTYEEDRQRR